MGLSKSVEIPLSTEKLEHSHHYVLVKSLYFSPKIVLFSLQFFCACLKSFFHSPPYQGFMSLSFLLASFF